MSTGKSSTSPTPTRAQAIVEFLQGEGIAHELVEHDLTMTAAAEARAAHISPERFAKTLILRDGAGPVIVAIPASERLDLVKLRNLLEATRQLQLATEDEIAAEFPSFEVGAVPPFGPMVPAVEVIDRRLLECERIACPAGDHRHAVMLDPREVRRITAARVGDICQD